MKVRSALLLTFLLALAACVSVGEQAVVSAERYNDLSYRLRYSDISASLQAAKTARSLSPKNSDGQAEALNDINGC